MLSLGARATTARAAPRPAAGRAPGTARTPLPRGRARARPVALGQARAACLRVCADAGAPPAPPAPAARSFDFLVLGSGIAGLTYALRVAQHGSVAVVTKEAAHEGCTQYAQGGVSAVLAETDSVEDHVRDTLVAGDFLNTREVVEVVCREGPAEVLRLAELGARFSRSRSGALHLTREGGHSARRVVHAEDATGREIERALLEAARASGVAFFEHHLATDLVCDEVGGVRTCLGADVLDQRAGALCRFVAPVTMLATGGAGQVYPVTTNPAVSTGDGMAMAARAAAAMEGLEFVQFHPTAFHSPVKQASARTFLISEAVRGEGGLLLNRAGRRFMADYDPRLELAPRDVVARAIQDQMLSRGDPHVLLDISHCQADHILTHFPNIAAQCRAHGIDITRAPIPVAPAAHYMCGGVKTGLLGQTTLAGLYAAGEVACTGLHGANRLASNSLLEGLVFAARAAAPSVAHAEAAQRTAGLALHHAAAHASATGPVAKLQPGAREWVGAKRAQLQALMWRGAGITRRTADMRAALTEASLLGLEAQALLQTYGCCTELLELRNLVTVGTCVLEAALRRRESRGGHYTLDFPPKPRLAEHGGLPATERSAGRAARLPKRSLADLGGAVRGRSPPGRKAGAREVVFRSHKEPKE